MLYVAHCQVGKLLALNVETVELLGKIHQKIFADQRNLTLKNDLVPEVITQNGLRSIVQIPKIHNRIQLLLIPDQVSLLEMIIVRGLGDELLQDARRSLDVVLVVVVLFHLEEEQSEVVCVFFLHFDEQSVVVDEAVHDFEGLSLTLDDLVDGNDIEGNDYVGKLIDLEELEASSMEDHQEGVVDLEFLHEDHLLHLRKRLQVEFVLGQVFILEELGLLLGDRAEDDFCHLFLCLEDGVGLQEVDSFVGDNPGQQRPQEDQSAHYYFYNNFHFA